MGLKKKGGGGREEEEDLRWEVDVKKEGREDR